MNEQKIERVTYMVDEIMTFASELNAHDNANAERAQMIIENADEIRGYMEKEREHLRGASWCASRGRYVRN